MHIFQPVTATEGQKIEPQRVDWFNLPEQQRRTLYGKLTTPTPLDQDRLMLYLEPDEIDKLVSFGMGVIDQFELTRARNMGFTHFCLVPPIPNDRLRNSPRIFGKKEHSLTLDDTDIRVSTNDLFDYLFPEHRTK